MDSDQPDDKAIAFREGQCYQRERSIKQLSSLRHIPSDYYDGASSPALKSWNRAIDKCVSIIKNDNGK